MSNVLYLSSIETPFGKMIIGTNNDAVCVLRFSNKSGDRNFLTHYLNETGLISVNMKTPLHQKVEKQLTRFFEGTRTSFDFPIQLFGSDFQISVWEEVYKLELAEKIDLKELAKRVGILNLKSVERACVANPVSMVIPSHRVEGFSEFEGAANRKLLLNRFESFFQQMTNVKMAA